MALTIKDENKKPLLELIDLDDGMIVRDISDSSPESSLYVVNRYQDIVAFSIKGNAIIFESSMRHHKLVEVDAELIIKS